MVPAPDGQAATQLWLMLPGAYMKPADFIAADFVQALHQRRLPHDVALLDASIPEVADGSALRFLQKYLREQAPMPQRRIALLGISLGAHLALSCFAGAADGEAQASAASHVASACLLAPYLGPRDVTGEVAAAPSLAQWEPSGEGPLDIDRRIWRWLRDRDRNDGGNGGPPLYLGYGSDDRFASAHALMAQAVPAGNVDVQPGAHTWPVWSALWNRHLDRFYAAG